MGLAWIKIRNHDPREVEEEGNEDAALPQSSNVSTNSSKAKLKDKVRKAHQESRDSEEAFGAQQQYEPVAWRSPSNRTLGADVGRIVERDGGPVAVLPAMLPGIKAGEGRDHYS